MTTNWLENWFSTGSVSCYPASMVNFILFTDKMFIVSALSNMGA